LSVDDLAVVLFAVDRVGKKGLSHGQLRLAFRQCGQGWCGAKVKPCFDALLAMGLIVHVGNYSAGSHGNKYRRSYPPTDISKWISEL
jgi:hypothetical protein